MDAMRRSFTRAVGRWLDADSRAALILADIGVERFEEAGIASRHPTRVVNVGIRESLAIGVAAGFALEGHQPLVHTYAPFLVERPFEAIKLDLVHQGLSATLVSIGASFDAAAEGRTHQAPEDVALLSTLPGVRIEIPGHADEVEPALHRALRHHGLAYVRLAVNENAEPRPAGVSVVREGRAGVVVALGPVLDAVLAASADLDLRVLYSASARPLDGLRRALGDARRVAVVEPALEGSSRNAVIEAVGSHVPVEAIGVRAVELRRYGAPSDHARAHGLDARSLRHRMRRWLSPDPG